MYSLICLAFAVLLIQYAPVHSQAYSDHVTNAVLFSAGLTRTASFRGGETVVFDKIFTNMGGAYGSSSGVFTSPQNGLYAFHVHAYNSNKDRAMWIELFKNQDFEISISGYNSHSTAGNSVILFLRKGDTVSVKARPNQTFTLFGQPDEIYASFMGYLLHKLAGDNDPPNVVG